MKSTYHNLDSDNLLSCNQGELVPIGVVPVLPGDRVQHHTSALVRVQPQLAPIYAKCDVTIHHWFVPNRIIWSEWEDFWTGGPDGNNASVHPYIETPASTGFAIGSLADYLGVKTGVPGKQISALPFRAYAAIWNHFYRDENLQNELVFSTASGLDTTTNLLLQNGCWGKDYFTSARPEPQLGTDVTIPMVGNAPIVGIGKANANFVTAGSANVRESGGVNATYTGRQLIDGNTTSDEQFIVQEDPDHPGYPGIYADLTGVSAISVIANRIANGLQRLKEGRMRFGNRYNEVLRMYGVANQDARLQIPEYLGGGLSTIQFSEVLQTAEGENPVGEMRGHGIGSTRTNSYRRFFPEHGFVISLMCVRPRTGYMTSMHRSWFYRTKDDYYQPELAHVGQQEVFNGEIDLSHTDPYGTWGYQDRYDELRFAESRVAGEFRDTLDFWHMFRNFETPPVLNADFVKANPTDRIYAVPSADQLYVRVLHKCRAKRKIPKYGKSFIY